MKTYLKIATFSIMVAIVGTGCYSAQSSTSQQYNQPQQYQNEPAVSMDVFYNELSPYGRWVDYQNYGRVWVSNERNFAPYRTGGHWAYTDYGWTWASDYSWGWAPFHYGRWIEDPFYGWAWVPGYDWAPAWVSWRRSDSYYGWAPLGPGINVNIGFGSIPNTHWNFVPNRYINSTNVGNYYVGSNQNTVIINNTTIINNTNIYRNARYISGPERQDAERFTGSRINAIRVNNTARPSNNIDNRGFNIYRPNVRNNNNPIAQPNTNENPRGNMVDGYNKPISNMSNRQPETSERSDGNTITTLDNKLPIRVANRNDDRGNVGDIRNNSPSNNTPARTPQARSETKPMIIPPAQNTIPVKPINSRNWGKDRDGRPSTSPLQPRNDKRGNFPQIQSEKRPTNNQLPQIENRPIQQLPHKRSTEVSKQP